LYGRKKEERIEMESIEPICDNIFKPKVNGIEIRPVFSGDFDRSQHRGKYQVRISIWGLPARIIQKIFKKTWDKRGISPD
jgi:hypothetical protein